MAKRKPKKIKPEDLVIHILNVGFGDTIIIEFPAERLKKGSKKGDKRSYSIVDCADADKTKKYLERLTGGKKQQHLEVVCATHPHMDHIRGIRSILTDRDYHVKEFWDSGFRHNSLTYRRIIKAILKKKIRIIRVSSGMEWYFGKVRVTALSPSVMLRNQYATHGIDMNNASIVLRLEHHEKDVLVMKSQEYRGGKSKEAVRKAGKSVVILVCDAEFDAWAQISKEYPKHERTDTHRPLIKKMVNYLSAAVVKVAHHGSMHSAPLDIYEKMRLNGKINLILAISQLPF